MCVCDREKERVCMSIYECVFVHLRWTGSTPATDSIADAPGPSQGSGVSPSIAVPKLQCNQQKECLYI